MSNRIIKHSSRYKGPAGDSRPAAEIFGGIEAREKQTQKFEKILTDAFDSVLRSATLSDPEDRISIVWDAAVQWRVKHDLEFAERVNPTRREQTNE